MAARVLVLLAAGGEQWEAEALRLLPEHGVVVLRRCVDLHDLIAAASSGVAEVAVVVLSVVDLCGEVARHAVVVVRRVGVVLVVDEVLRRRVLLPDRLRGNRTPRPSAKSVVFRTHSP